jgi:exopolysaccharide production protein ExoQ
MTSLFSRLVKSQVTNQARLAVSDFPPLPDTHAIALVATTLVVLAYAGWFGIYPILLFYALWFPLAKYKGNFTLRLTSDLYPFICLEALCLLSTLWSDYWDVTAKAALESISMVACTIIIARVTTLDAFLKGINLGTTLALAVTLLDGSYGTDFFTGTTSLVGLFGSKNQVGFYGQIGSFTALLIFFTARHWIEKFLYSGMSLIICAASLYMSRSATALVTLLATLLVCLAGYLVAKLPRHTRVPFLLVGIFLVGSVLTIGISLDWLDVGFSLLGKDSTLTGRTFLWSEGLNFGMQNPLLGCGFYAFWVPGRPLAEVLWLKFDIAGRTGFHFHNTFIQAFVDLGIAGLGMLITILVMSLIKSVRYVIKTGASMLAFYALGMSVMFLMRAFVEVDIWGTFHAAILLFFSVLPRLAQQQARKQNDTTAVPTGLPSKHAAAKAA